MIRIEGASDNTVISRNSCMTMATLPESAAGSSPTLIRGAAGLPERGGSDQAQPDRNKQDTDPSMRRTAARREFGQSGFGQFAGISVHFRFLRLPPIFFRRSATMLPKVP